MQTFLMIAAIAAWVAMVAYLLRSRSHRTAYTPEPEHWTFMDHQAPELTEEEIEILRRSSDWDRVRL